MNFIVVLEHLYPTYVLNPSMGFSWMRAFWTDFDAPPVLYQGLGSIRDAVPRFPHSVSPSFVGVMRRPVFLF